MNRKHIAALVRGLRFVFGIILLLSLPTFSYLIPTLRDNSGSVQRGGTTGGFSTKSSFRSQDGVSPLVGDRFVRTRTGGIFARSGYPRRSERTRTSRVSRNSPTRRASERGLNRLARRAGSQDRSTSRPSEERPATGPQKETLPPNGRELNELSRMEQDYQDTLSYLFPSQSLFMGSTVDNPFQRALENQGSGGSSGGASSDPASPSDPGASGEGDGSGDTGGGSDGDGSSDSGGQPGGQDTQKSYDFLILGNIESDGNVARAFRDSDGAFVLESGDRVRLFASSGIVGVPQELVLAFRGEQVLSTDFSGDGVDDLVVSGSEYPMSYIRGYLHPEAVGLDLQFEGIFQDLTIKSLAIHDFEGDGELELAVALAGSSNLVVYKIVEDKLVYSRELALPFQPAALLATQDQGIFKFRYLHVFDQGMQRSITLSSRYPGLYSFGKPPSYQSSENVRLDPVGNSAEGDEFMVVHYEDKVLLVEMVNGDTVFLGSFGARNGQPTVLVGDYRGDGSRQLVFVP